jgi:hypothetical protein
MTAAAYGSRIGARHARLSGTTKTISDLIFKQQTRVRLLAARFARGLNKLCPLDKREQGMPGARCTRGLVCKIVRKPHTSIQVQRRHSGIPCAMALRLMPCSPRRRIRLVTVAAGLMAISIRLDRIRHRQLGTSNGCRDHTVLPYALAPFVCALLIAHGNPPCDHAAHRRCRVHRIPSRVRDDARPPLLPGKDGRSGSADLPDGKSEIFFGMGLDRSLVICPSGQFAAPARATSSLRAKRSNR